MKTSKLKRILFLVISVSLLTLLVFSNLKLNYKTIVLSTNIKMVKEYDKILNIQKLQFIPEFSTLYSFFTMKLVGERIYNKISSGDFCDRTNQAKKRNISIKPSTYDLSIEILFTDQSNVYKCKNELLSYVNQQRDLFIQETDIVVEKYVNKSSTAMVLRRPFNMDKTEIIIRREDVSKSDKQAENEYVKDTFEMFKNSELYFVSQNLTEKEINKNLLLTLIFAISFLVMFMIIFNKEIKEFFKKFI